MSLSVNEQIYFNKKKIRVSNNPYAYVIVMVRKADGSVCVCIDYRAINEREVRDSFPLPRIDDLIDRLRESRCITHLYLRPAYNIKYECRTTARHTTPSKQRLFKASHQKVRPVY